jgi:hypothetical protein
LVGQLLGFCYQRTERRLNADRLRLARAALQQDGYGGGGHDQR